MPKRADIKKIMVIGSGPIVIGQAAEFDYSGTQACKALREEGYEVVLVNSNPATIQTDLTTADIVYIEPLNVETVAEVQKPFFAASIAKLITELVDQLKSSESEYSQKLLERGKSDNKAEFGPLGMDAALIFLNLLRKSEEICEAIRERLTRTNLDLSTTKNETG